MIHRVLTVVTALLTRGCPSSHRPQVRGSLQGVGCTWPACTRSVCEDARTGTRLPSGLSNNNATMSRGGSCTAELEFELPI